MDARDSQVWKIDSTTIVADSFDSAVAAWREYQLADFEAETGKTPDRPFSPQAVERLHYAAVVVAPDD